MKRLRLLTFALVSLAGTMPAAAEHLVVSLSNHRVAINSNFIGEELVLFGTIEPDPNSSLRSANYDVVVTVIGPVKTFRTRRKAQVAGIWVNVDSREFLKVPSYLATLSNRPVSDIAKPEALRRLQIGLDNMILTQRVGGDFADTVHDDPFRAAFVNLEQQSGFYSERSTGVTFLTSSVFRANISMPANASIGNYAVEVKLFTNGTVLAATTSAFEIIKAGFEQYVANAALNQSLLYGLATTMLALLTGWFASVVFRRD